ncbi:MULTISPECIES: alpha/beta fold hydrolase [Rhodanobacter]|uniref:Alpha/beta fold hydrolase n=1 Tax=Rhodanobacter ginsenosidimutans TaxID=490571 RepID=A0ABW0JRQ4_9GAMM|nr:alpha/beta fold hydrolase [Rhodanobacter sp. Root627]KRA33396.1 alpha/beta hydrolase [Rhodanobacter sp. Root627]
MIEPRERRITLPHLTLAAQVWGDDTLPPLLALHGWLDNAGSYARLAPLLATRFQLIALDLPGHGHADHVAAGAQYHYADYVRTVLAAADALALDRYSLLGHSLGAGIASLVATAAPSRIERLWLIEGLGPLGDDGTRTLQRFREALAPQATRKPLRLFRSVEQAVDARSIASGLRGDLARPIVTRGLVDVDGGWRWRSDPRLTQPSATRLAESQVRALLQGIASPTALLLARPSTSYLPAALMQARIDCVEDIAVSHMDGGHHLHLEHPAAVATWIKAADEPAR